MSSTRYRVVFTPVGWQIVDTVVARDPIAQFGTGHAEYARANVEASAMNSDDEDGLDYDRASGAFVEITVEDAVFIAENLDYLAGVDEGENTDYDRLLAIAKRLTAATEGVTT